MAVQSFQDRTDPRGIWRPSLAAFQTKVVDLDNHFAVEPQKALVVAEGGLRFWRAAPLLGRTRMRLLNVDPMHKHEREILQVAS